MGFLDSLFGKDDDDATEGTKGPGMILREAGIDTSGIKFKFNSDGTLTVTGEVADEARRARIEEILQGVDQVKMVDNQLVITVPKPEHLPDTVAGTVTVGGGSAPVTADAEATQDTPSESDGGGDASAAEAADVPTYTVQSGDTLWKIAKEAYGSGGEYMKIFEANRDQLDNPDLIRPGQVLKIPPRS